MLSESFRTTPSHCPYCDYLLDAATNFLSKDGPTPGDWTICASCAQPLIFGDDMVVRKPRAGELEAQEAIHPDLSKEVDFFTSVVRSVDRRPPEEQKERPLKRPLNRQQRRQQERQQRRMQIIVVPIR